MSDIDRREFLSKTALIATGALATTLLSEKLLAQEAPVATMELDVEVDEHFWIGGY